MVRKEYELDKRGLSKSKKHRARASPGSPSILKINKNAQHEIHPRIRRSRPSRRSSVIDRGSDPPFSPTKPSYC